MLRQFGYITQESLAVYPNRLKENRGNGYLQPYNQIVDQGLAASKGIFPNFDCDNTGGGERLGSDGGTPPVSTQADPLPGHSERNAFAPCFVAPDFPAEYGGGQSPQLEMDP